MSLFWYQIEWIRISLHSMVGFANLMLNIVITVITYVRTFQAIMVPYHREAPHVGKGEPRAFMYGQNEFGDVSIRFYGSHGNLLKNIINKINTWIKYLRSRHTRSYTKPTNTHNVRNHTRTPIAFVFYYYYFFFTSNWPRRILPVFQFMTCPFPYAGRLINVGRRSVRYRCDRRGTTMRGGCWPTVAYANRTRRSWK